MTIRLYELVDAKDRSISPFVWRIKYALAHKGLDFETMPVGFGDIPGVCGGKFKTVPIIEDGAVSMNESLAIADYLDKTYPDRPAIFATPQERAMARFFDGWFGLEIMNRMFSINVLDIHNHARTIDQPYFRQSREARLGGKTLEQLVEGREAKIPELRNALRPMRAALAAAPFLGGDAPSYADYIALGGFIWAGTVCTVPLLAADDKLNDWLARGLALYDGLGNVETYPLSA